MGHLGTKVSALLDGQLDPAETERAWAHVHACHSCRDEVEREGWVKTRLAGLSFGGASAPDSLKGALRGAPLGVPAGDLHLDPAHLDPAHLHQAGPATLRPRRTASLVAIGGGAVGAAVLGVIALGAAPADVPANDRRPPVMNIGSSTPSPSPTAPSTPAVRRP